MNDYCFVCMRVCLTPVSMKNRPVRKISDFRLSFWAAIQNKISCLYLYVAGWN